MTVEAAITGMEQVPIRPRTMSRCSSISFETSSDAVYITDRRRRGARRERLRALPVRLRTRGGDRSQPAELGLWANPNDRQTFLEAIQREGRVRRYAVRFRTKWSEEFTLELSATPAQMLGENVILGGVLSQIGLSHRAPGARGASRSTPTRTGVVGRP